MTILKILGTCNNIFLSMNHGTRLYHNAVWSFEVNKNSPVGLKRRFNKSEWYMCVRSLLNGLSRF